MERNTDFLTVVKWISRIMCTLLFLLWGAFFVEHLAWFSDLSNLPPAGVTVRMLLHFILLLSMLLVWKFEFAGGIMILISSTLFFGSIFDN